MLMYWFITMQQKDSCSESSEEERDDIKNVSECINKEAVEIVKKLNNQVQNLEITTCKNEDYYYEAQYLLQELIKSLSGVDTTFLSDYLDVLLSNNVTTIRCVTDNIISSIEVMISSERERGRKLQESEIVVLVSWLLAATVWNAPNVPSARPALHALLPLLTENESQQISNAWEQCMPPVILLELSDAATVPPGATAGESLGARLLRGVERALGCLDSLGDLQALAEGEEALLRLRAVGRALHAGHCDGLSGASMSPPAISKAIERVVDIQRVLVISKLQRIFGDDSENIALSEYDSQESKISETMEEASTADQPGGV